MAYIEYTSNQMIRIRLERAYREDKSEKIDMIGYEVFDYGSQFYCTKLFLLLWLL